MPVAKTLAGRAKIQEETEAFEHAAWLNYFDVKGNYSDFLFYIHVIPVV